MPANRPPQDVVDVALEVSAYLASHNLDYAFGGALALGFWAAPRGTIHVDLTLCISPDDPTDASNCFATLDATFDALTR